MEIKKIIWIAIVGSVISLSSCSKFLDVVPDNIATIQDAFTSKAMAERYLHTCYSYLPVDANPSNNPAFMGADEMWMYAAIRDFSWRIPFDSWLMAQGEMGITSPYFNYWDGEGGVKSMYRAIRDCNIFLENINTPLDLKSYQRDQWVAEVKFLKAYYHFYLFRMYGPIVLVKDNLPISSTPDQVKVHRASVDETVAYIVQLLDEATEGLPEQVLSPTTDLGRATKPIAMSIKARVLLLAASPLFNGNTEMASLVDNTGKQLFNQQVDKEKWKLAMDAAKEAIDKAELAGNKIYEFLPTATTGTLSDETKRLLSIQGAVTDEWNSELIWGLTNSDTYLLQNQSMARLVRNVEVWTSLAPPLKIAEQFYSKNGVPINEDVNYPYQNRFNFRVGDQGHKYYVKEGETTIQLHFDREPRFYADMGFDRGIWYGIDRFKDGTPDIHFMKARFEETSGQINQRDFTVTGYLPKKLVNYLNNVKPDTEGGAITIKRYPWPVVRLADVYLMYAEASNEYEGPNPEGISYLDKIRKRAGLKGVVESWSQFSKVPNKPSTKEGLRAIIQQERLIEMAFEGSRLWDLRRWKTAINVLNQPIIGWDVGQKTLEGFYRQKVLHNQEFGLKDYFWPIKDNSLLVNGNLIQNVGW